MSFKEFLLSKKINPDTFRQAQRERYEEWSTLFSVIHPTSFEVQKKFLLNRVRREFPIVPEKVI